MSMRYVITEQQYDRLRYKRRYEDIKNLIDGLIGDDLSVYYDEDEFYSDIKDLVFRNVFLGKRQNLSWDEIDRDELMDFIDDAFEDYIREKYREYYD
jgi:hypothetical protein